VHGTYHHLLLLPIRLSTMLQHQPLIGADLSAVATSDDLRGTRDGGAQALIVNLSAAALHRHSCCRCCRGFAGPIGQFTTRIHEIEHVSDRSFVRVHRLIETL